MAGCARHKQVKRSFGEKPYIGQQSQGGSRKKQRIRPKQFNRAGNSVASCSIDTSGFVLAGFRNDQVSEGRMVT